MCRRLDDRSSGGQLRLPADLSCRQPAQGDGDAPSQGCGKMATSEARDDLTRQRCDVHAPLRGLAAEQAINLAQARRVRGLRRRGRRRFARRRTAQPVGPASWPDNVVTEKRTLRLTTSSRRRRDLPGEPACARGFPSQGCDEMTTSEARDALTRQRCDVHAPLRGLAAGQAINLAQARRVRGLRRR